MPKTILVVVDPATPENQPVVERAAWLAEKTGAAIELFACDYDANVDAVSDAAVGSATMATATMRTASMGVADAACVDGPESGIRERVLRRHRETLEALAAPLRARGLGVTVNVVWDYPLGDAILKRAVAEPPWLVAKDTAYYTLLQRAFLTHTDWQLVRDCPAPLLLVKPRHVPANPTVLAALDPLHVHDKPAALDEAIYAFAAGFAQSVGGTLHVVHAASPPMGVELPPQVQARLDAEHRNAILSFTETHPVARDNVHVLAGRAHDCLQQAAEHHDASFLVMGAVARRGIAKLLIGSTAARVLDRLPCDLVIIKPPELFARR